MSVVWPIKYVDEVIDYSLDWSSRLGDDTIANVVWTIPSGLTSESEVNTGTIASVFLSGGVQSSTYEIVCQIVTTGSRTLIQKCYLTVV